MTTRKALSMAILAATLGLCMSTRANAALTLLKPNPAVPATFVGQGGYSSDGLGQQGVGGTVQAEVPAGSTVVQAYLYGTYFTTAPTLAERTIDFDGTSVELVTISVVNFLSTGWADVTAQVATKVGSGGGITDFTINTDPYPLDGLALVVIYSNPASPLITIAVLEGGASQLGDTATFSFAAPLDKTIAGFSAIMSLGSGFSYQGVSGHDCGGGQFSVVTINGQLLTNCAGNFDDGEAANGALLTVGGVGDSLDNPTPPEAPLTDDELYNLEPFLAQGDSGITIETSNPSQDDNLFLAIIAITAEGRVTTEVCDDGIDNDGDGLIDLEDPDCQPVNPEICDDGIDNDGDGLIDGDDPDCIETYVDLGRFSVTPKDRRVIAEWNTMAEIDNAGFYLLRRDVRAGTSVRVNRGLIPARGDVYSGANYQFLDNTAVNGVEFQYTLVDVDRFAKETRHESTRVVANPINPRIKLASPAYDARITAAKKTTFAWAPVSLFRASLRISSDATFPAESTVSFGIDARQTATGRATLNQRQQMAVNDLAARNGGVLYWQIVDLSSINPASDHSGTIRYSYELPSAQGVRSSGLRTPSRR